MREDDKKILIAQINDSKIIGMISMVFLSRLNQNTLEMYIPELLFHKIIILTELEKN